MLKDAVATYVERHLEQLERLAEIADGIEVADPPTSYLAPSSQVTISFLAVCSVAVLPPLILNIFTFPLLILQHSPPGWDWPGSDDARCRILLVVEFQLFVQFRALFPQVHGRFEKGFRGHGKKLGGIGRAIGVER